MLCIYVWNFPAILDVIAQSDINYASPSLSLSAVLIKWVYTLGFSAYNTSKNLLWVTAHKYHKLILICYFHMSG